MPVLPLNHVEPFAVTLGVMLYPGFDEAERQKARAFTAQYLVRPIRSFCEAGGQLSLEQWRELYMDVGQPLIDLESRWRAGTAMGAVFAYYCALATNHPDLASWNNAYKCAQIEARQRKESCSRSALSVMKKLYLPVAHFWCAWTVRGGQFGERIEDGSKEFLSFLAEAELYRRWGQTWRAPRAKSKSPLPDEVWHVSDSLRLPSPVGGSDEVVVPALLLPADMVAQLRPAGRPGRVG